MPQPLIPAATVVPLRQGDGCVEVLMLLRSTRGSFGGMWVFPGGKVDAADRRGGPPGGEGQARRAAVREAREEAGLVLAEASLVPLSLWIPPVEAARRYSTWFFLAGTDQAARVEVDGSEVLEHMWVRPASAMGERDSGGIVLAPPTFMTLWWLSAHPRVEDAVAAAGTGPPERFETRVVEGEEGEALAALWGGDVAYEDLDLRRPGPRRRLLLEPSGWRVEWSGGAGT